MEERKCKFVVGDIVRVKDYGSKQWIKDPLDDKVKLVDTQRGTVGKMGVVRDSHLTQNVPYIPMEEISWDLKHGLMKTSLK